MNLLYVDISQFGYHTDAYYYARHLSKSMNVTYIGCHQGKKEMDPGGVQVIYVSGSKNILIRHLKFYVACFRELRKGNYEGVFICYSIFCSILRILFPKHKMMVDVRTGYVERLKWMNAIFNDLLKLEISLFRNVTFISGELAEYFNFKRSFLVLPVGAEYIENVPAKKFDSLSLLYVGTFFGRNLEITIRGFKKFIDSYDHSIPVSYTLIGFGPDKEIQKIKSEISRLQLEEWVEYKGEIRPPQLDYYFEHCNVGLSFVPILPQYDCQPPTKNYEYLMHGMPILATSTRFNKNFIQPGFGELIADTEEGFCHGLKEIVTRINTFDRHYIYNVAQKHSYEFIVEQILLPYCWYVMGNSKLGNDFMN